MNFDFIQQATSKELEQFKSVCNQLLRIGLLSIDNL